MPAKTKKQQKFMGMCYHDPKKVLGKCPPPDVSKKFSKAPKKKPKGY
jgi:hypothetical protein